MLLKYKKETDKIERVLWFDEASNIVVVIDIFNDEWPQFIEFIELIKLIEIGDIEVLEKDPIKRVVKEEDISEKDRTIREKAWNIVYILIERIPEPIIFYIHERTKVVNALTKEFKVSRNSINNYLKRYWKHGKCKNALLSNYFKCGGASVEKKAGELKRGRPRKFGGTLGKGINIDEEVRRVFRVAINKYYNTSKKNSLVTSYEFMLKDFFYEDYKIQNGIKIPVLKDRDEIPTLEQFRYWFNKERNIKREITLRNSSRKYELNNRAILGSSTYEAIGPTSIYQIDATVADIYLVSRFNRNWIIGRPVVYSIKDVYSSMVAGISVSLEGPSWVGAMVALFNAMSNKVSFCKEYGIEIEQEQWPCCYLPNSILADRGELEGYNIETLVANLGIKVSNTPSFRADWKGIVEQYFRIINLKVKPLVPGVINEDFRQRFSKDYRLDAKLDLYQFTQIIIKCALYHNNSHYIRNFNREELMIKDDIVPTPINIWNWGIKNKVGKLRVLPEDIIKLNLMPTDFAVVTENGIRFQEMYYGSEMALKERWFETARNKGHWRIKVSYDPRKLNFIYIITDNGLNFEKCFLLKHQGRYMDRTIEEIQYLLQMESLNMQSNSVEEIQSKIDLVSEIEEVVKNAENLTNREKVDGESDSSRIKGIRVNRAIEKFENRKREGFEIDVRNIEENKVISYASSDKEEIENNINDIDILRKMQRERRMKSNE
jgi:hypothetical protein